MKEAARRRAGSPTPAPCAAGGLQSPARSAHPHDEEALWNKEYLFGILIERLRQFHEKNPEAGTTAARACVGAARFASLISDFPRMARMVFDYALRRRSIQGRVEEVRAEIDSASGHVGALGATLTARLDAHLCDTVFAASLNGFWVLLAANAVAILAAFFWLR